MFEMVGAARVRKRELLLEGIGAVNLLFDFKILGVSHCF